jgi:hypothetical protein
MSKITQMNSIKNIRLEKLELITCFNYLNYFHTLIDSRPIKKLIDYFKSLAKICVLLALQHCASWLKSRYNRHKHMYLAFFFIFFFEIQLVKYVLQCKEDPWNPLLNSAICKSFEICPKWRLPHKNWT